MRKLPFVIFILIMMSALYSCFSSYRSTENKIAYDVNNALGKTLAQLPKDVVNADTIRLYHDELTIEEIKESASIAMRTVNRNGKQETEMVALANCNFYTILKLSDQRASSALFLLALLWIGISLWYIRRFKPELLIKGLHYGSIIYTNHNFLTAKGDKIHLTPMQHTLMEMFMNSQDHSLSKQEIYEHLWPNKPDASATLYTLIKRIKPIIEANSNLKIESCRGESYRLKIK